MKMLELRKAVYTADSQNTDVEVVLNNLRSFVHGHMNTNLRSGMSGDEAPIQLVNRFNGAVAAEQARVASQGSANKVYVEAQNQCEKSSLSLTARAQCIQDYVSSHGTNLPPLNLPPKEFYTFDFVSPIWSPDLAGFSMLISVLLLIAITARLLADVIIKRRYK
jgi:hypothetical protein